MRNTVSTFPGASYMRGKSLICILGNTPLPSTEAPNGCAILPLATADGDLWRGNDETRSLFSWYKSSRSGISRGPSPLYSTAQLLAAARDNHYSAVDHQQCHV